VFQDPGSGQESKNDPQKIEKVQKFHVLQCWMFLFAPDPSIIKQN
jgi:hypothetical protein